MDIGETPFYPIMVKAETLVIDTEEIKNRRVEIVHCHLVFHGLIPKLVGRSVTEGRFHACAGHPRSKAPRIMITATGSLLESWHSAELRAEHHQGMLQEPTFLQVLEERGSGLVQHGAMD